MPDARNSGQEKMILTVISLAVFMADLDTSIVNISLPHPPPLPPR